MAPKGARENLTPRVISRWSGPPPSLSQMSVDLESLAAVLDAAPRCGAEVDFPEGRRFILLGDTVAQRLAGTFRLWAKKLAN